MTRLARLVFPGLPHHVTQRGNRREAIFFEDGDQEIYRDLLAEQTRKAGVEVWAYCLMPNHVHLILTPSTADGLGRAVGEAHRRYTNFINARGRWTGHLFQGRFGSVAMDEDHLMAAFRYVPLNPVKAGLVERPGDWPWSSARAHLARQSTPYVDVEPALSRIDDVAAFLSLTGEPHIEAQWSDVLKAEQIGRPVGAKAWIQQLEQQHQKSFSPRRRGPARARGWATRRSRVPGKSLAARSNPGDRRRRYVH